MFPYDNNQQIAPSYRADEFIVRVIYNEIFSESYRTVEKTSRPSALISFSAASVVRVERTDN